MWCYNCQLYSLNVINYTIFVRVDSRIVKFTVISHLLTNTFSPDLQINKSILTQMYVTYKVLLGATHKCQHFHECTNHTLSGGGAVKINIFSVHLTFWPDFYYFQQDFWHSSFVLYSFLGEGGGLRKCMVCTLLKMLTFMNSPLLLPMKRFICIFIF